MLPKIEVPTYDLELISNGKKIKFRPFLVKEEKILLMALESGDEKDILGAIKQILSNCVLTELDIDDLPLFDLQHIFLQLRSRSIGETIEVNLKHRNGVNSKGIECDGNQKIKIKIDEIKPTKKENFSPKIEFNSEMGIMMKYPTVETLSKVSTSENIGNSFDELFEVIVNSIDYIYLKDELYHRKEHKKEEFIEFLNNLNNDQFESIKNFFVNLPSISVNKKYRCSKCGIEENVVLSSLEDFFS